MIEHNCSSHAHLEAHSLQGSWLQTREKELVEDRKGTATAAEAFKLKHHLQAEGHTQGEEVTLWKTHQANLHWYFTSKNTNWQLLTITWLCQYQASFFSLFSTHLNANYLTLNWALHKDLAVKMSNPAQQLAGKQLSKAPSDTFSAIFDHCWRPHLKKETLQGRFPYGWVE